MELQDWKQQFFDAFYGRNRERLVALLDVSDPASVKSITALALRLAIDRGDDDLSNTLLGSAVSPEFADADGSTPLIWAAAAGNDRILSRLLELGAIVDAADNVGWTALFHAAAAGSLQCVEELLKAGADTEKRDAFGTTALDAAKYRRFSCRVPILGVVTGRTPRLFESPVHALLRSRSRGRRS